LKVYFSFGLILLLVVVCSACIQPIIIDSSKVDNNNTIQADYKKDNKFESEPDGCFFYTDWSEAPDWYCTKDKLSATGSCKIKNDRDKARDCAISDANVRLAFQMRVKVNALIKRHLHNINNKIFEQITFENEQTTNVELYTQLAEEKVHNNMYYVLVRLTPNKLIDYIKSISGKRLWEELLGKVSVEKITNEITKRDLELQENIEKNRSLISNVTDKLKNALTNINQQSIQIKNTIESNRKSLTNVCSELAEANQRYTKINNLVVSNTESLTKVYDIINSNETSLTDIMSKLASIERQYIKLNKDINDIKLQYTLVNNALSSNAKLLTEVNLKVQKLTDQYTKLDVKRAIESKDTIDCLFVKYMKQMSRNEFNLERFCNEDENCQKKTRELSEKCSKLNIEYKRERINFDDRKRRRIQPIEREYNSQTEPKDK